MFFLNDEIYFPPVERANEDGLLAVGGDLSVPRLKRAYKNGIFPWFNDDSLFLWWSPDPRFVLYPQKIKISKSMAKVMRSGQFRLTIDKAAEKVIYHCSLTKRKDQEGTWITPKLLEAYKGLIEDGCLRSYEVWQGDRLVGGLYGIDLGHVFCGESMFSLVSNASKFALIHLAQNLEQKNYRLIDCQIPSKHLTSMGAECISREGFIGILLDKDEN